MLDESFDALAMERIVVNQEALRMLRKRINADTYPHLAALQDDDEPSRETIDLALEDFAQAYRLHKDTRFTAYRQIVRDALIDDGEIEENERKVMRSIAMVGELTDTECCQIESHVLLSVVERELKLKSDAFPEVFQKLNSGTPTRDRVSKAFAEFAKRWAETKQPDPDEATNDVLLPPVPVTAPPGPLTAQPQELAPLIEAPAPSNQSLVPVTPSGGLPREVSQAPVSVQTTYEGLDLPEQITGQQPVVLVVESKTAWALPVLVTLLLVLVGAGGFHILQQAKPAVAVANRAVATAATSAPVAAPTPRLPGRVEVSRAGAATPLVVNGPAPTISVTVFDSQGAQLESPTRLRVITPSGERTDVLQLKQAGTYRIFGCAGAVCSPNPVSIQVSPEATPQP